MAFQSGHGGTAVTGVGGSAAVTTWSLTDSVQLHDTSFQGGINHRTKLTGLSDSSANLKILIDDALDITSSSGSTSFVAGAAVTLVLPLNATDKWTMTGIIRSIAPTRDVNAVVSASMIVDGNAVLVPAIA